MRRTLTVENTAKSILIPDALNTSRLGRAEGTGGFFGFGMGAPERTVLRSITPTAAFSLLADCVHAIS
jgi:hypothetical protein